MTHIEKLHLEEAAKNYINSKNPEWTPYHKQSFKDGAKWQAERMYSEEEVHKIIESYKHNKPKVFLKVFYNEWFEQFKKKL